jgi:MFS family permease
MKPLSSQQRTIVSVLALSTLTMAMSATTPALADIAAAFPNAKQTSVAMLATIPSLFSVPCALITGRLLGRRVRYRTMALAAILLTIAGGLLPLFLNSLGLIIAARAMMGVGLGILNPITPSITMLELPKEFAQRQMGVNGATANAAAIVYQMIGGFACAISWRYSFLAYLLAVPVLPIVMMYLREPKIYMESERIEHDQSFGAAIRAFGKPFWGWFALSFFFITLFYAYITNISSIIANNNYGTASSSALVLAVFSIGGVIGGHIMSKLINKIEQGVFILAGMICFAGKIILVVGGNIALIYLGSIVYGFGYGMILPAIPLFAGMSVAPRQRAFAISVIMVANGLGTFLSAYIFAGIASAIGVNWDRLPILASSWGYLVISTIFTVVWLAGKCKIKSKENTMQKEGEDQ